ncbi:FAD-binding oxidoreductase [Corynebacterium callunae]|uniref:FAD-binding oxidoreductase n=1 Tax=Corynebacterium callunae TaxID=1721 RepID=UPI0039825073
MTDTIALKSEIGEITTLLSELEVAFPSLKIAWPSAETVEYSYDAGTVPKAQVQEPGPAVVWPSSVEEVQAILKAASRLHIGIVPRGEGTGLSGGATAASNQLVVSTQLLNKIVEINVEDELAVVEPGVINSELNEKVAPFGLFYAPDPASWNLSSIGGNVATNAGGLRCVKYGVTRESILSLDVVLSDGELITVGQRTLKGVTGLDLRSLIIGSEGILGIVVGATLRLRPIPPARKTISVWFPETQSGAAGLSAIARTPVRPSIIEFIDEPTLKAIDNASGTQLRSRGGSLILIELDGYGLDEQIVDLGAALTAVGGNVIEEDTDAGEVLWELRRSGRGGLDPRRWSISSDIAVPRSKFKDVFAYFPTLEEKYGVEVSALGHAGDGNLHPLISKEVPESADPATPDPAVAAANLDLIKFALSLGGTVTAEHGLGSAKRYLAELELSPRSLEIQHAIKRAFDPQSLINPGKAI